MPVISFIKPCLVMRIFIYTESMGFTTCTTHSAFLEVPWCWPWFLSVIIWSAGAHSWRVAFAAKVDADVVLFFRLCRCTAHICVMWSGPTPGTESVMVAVLPQMISSTGWTVDQRPAFTIWGGMWTGAQLNYIFWLSTLWAFYLTSFWWFLWWLLGLCKWIYYFCLTSVVGWIWCVQT